MGKKDKNVYNSRVYKDVIKKRYDLMQHHEVNVYVSNGKNDPKLEICNGKICTDYMKDGGEVTLHKYVGEKSELIKTKMKPMKNDSNIIYDTNYNLNTTQMFLDNNF